MAKRKGGKSEQLVLTAWEVTGRQTMQETLECLEQHGCVIERRRPPLRVRFPPGTRRFHIRITRTDHYRIRLPDGWLVSDLVTYDERLKQSRHLLIVSAESSASLPAGKPSFRDLCDRYDCNLAALSQAAGVSLRSVYFMREATRSRGKKRHACWRSFRGTRSRSIRWSILRSTSLLTRWRKSVLLERGVMRWNNGN